MSFHKPVLSVALAALFGAAAPLLTTLLLTTPVLAAPSVTAPNAGDATTVDDSAAIAVGTSLVAIADVNLSQASIRKGSKVLVTKVRDGQAGTTLDVQLPDGHVLRRIALVSIKSSFRVAS